MADPLGLIGSVGATSLLSAPKAVGQAGGVPGGPSFKDVLLKNIEQVNRLQQDADAAIEDLVSGRRDDLDAVLMAKQKADVAFQMLLQVRNKVMDAYEEVKQIRV
ncbi:MAG: flagellar hook-basal body complex protein FliE [Phycisphaeraceae bacterium]|nr:flagellar hook-basal body complex protein FliE [Phycisphaeraceae bacterium]